MDPNIFFNPKNNEVSKNPFMDGCYKLEEENSSDENVPINDLFFKYQTRALNGVDVADLNPFYTAPDETINKILGLLYNHKTTGTFITCSDKTKNAIMLYAYYSLKSCCPIQNKHAKFNQATIIALIQQLVEDYLAIAKDLNPNEQSILRGVIIMICLKLFNIACVPWKFMNEYITSLPLTTKYLDFIKEITTLIEEYKVFNGTGFLLKWLCWPIANSTTTNKVFKNNLSVSCHKIPCVMKLKKEGEVEATKLFFTTVEKSTNMTQQDMTTLACNTFSLCCIKYIVSSILKSSIDPAKNPKCCGSF